MGSESNTSSPDAAPVGCGAQLTRTRTKLPRGWLKYALFIAVLVNWIVTPFLFFSAPLFLEWLLVAYLLDLVVLFFLFLGALFRFRWKEVTILLAFLTIVLLPGYRFDQSFRWLYVEAFRFHVRPVDQYLSRCKLIEFIENGARQKVGVCQRLPLAGDNTMSIVYDTTGELALPLSRRTLQWTKAMAHFSPARVFTKLEGRARALFGNFYEVYIPLEDEDGAADEY